MCRICFQVVQKIFQRHRKSKTSTKKRRIYSQKANFASEYSTFLGESLTLGVSRKLSKQLGNMLWVCKTFSQIRGTQRILNQIRTTSKTFFIYGNLKLFHFSGKSTSIHFKKAFFEPEYSARCCFECPQKIFYTACIHVLGM